MNFLYMAGFGLVGIFSRFLINEYFAKLHESYFALGTFFINIIGSFLIGLIYVIGVERNMVSFDFRVGVMVGLLGGFTTFSGYSLDTLRLMAEGRVTWSLLYAIGSPTLGILAAMMGIYFTRTVLS